ncbi:hypothetical protein J6590_013310 [Homalodisca vitripennis]|nr:hypothetical protein J6590_013310 [Homalodisca vitripennis]
MQMQRPSSRKNATSLGSLYRKREISVLINNQPMGTMNGDWSCCRPVSRLHSSTRCPSCFLRPYGVPQETVLDPFLLCGNALRRDPVKLLGFALEKALPWDSLTDLLCIKISRVVYILRRLAVDLPSGFVRQAYVAIWPLHYVI